MLLLTENVCEPIVLMGKTRGDVPVKKALLYSDNDATEIFCSITGICNTCAISIIFLRLIPFKTSCSGAVIRFDCESTKNIFVRLPSHMFFDESTSTISYSCLL